MVRKETRGGKFRGRGRRGRGENVGEAQDAVAGGSRRQGSRRQAQHRYDQDFLPSNSFRYENPSNEIIEGFGTMGLSGDYGSEKYQMDYDNSNEFAQAPNAQDQYFQTSMERDWDDDTDVGDPAGTEDILALDIEQLGSSLRHVDIHIRLNLSMEYCEGLPALALHEEHHQFPALPKSPRNTDRQNSAKNSTASAAGQLDQLQHYSESQTSVAEFDDSTVDDILSTTDSKVQNFSEGTAGKEQAAVPQRATDTPLPSSKPTLEDLEGWLDDMLS